MPSNERGQECLYIGSSIVPLAHQLALACSIYVGSLSYQLALLAASARQKVVACKQLRRNHNHGRFNGHCHKRTNFKVARSCALCVEPNRALMLEPPCSHAQGLSVAPALLPDALELAPSLV